MTSLFPRMLYFRTGTSPVDTRQVSGGSGGAVTGKLAFAAQALQPQTPCYAGTKHAGGSRMKSLSACGSVCSGQGLRVQILPAGHGRLCGLHLAI